MAAMATAAANSLVQHLRKLAGPGMGKLSDRELLTRFIARRDEAAFAALMHRHGPMVWRVCRRWLPESHDAEDAFQATFLILSRKAASVRRKDSVGSWLYGVAYRVALKAKAAAARRYSLQPLSPQSQVIDPLADVTVREAQAILDQELTRLPDKNRAPLVLCCLEGATRDEAARQLGWSASLVKSRLEEARTRLRGRLVRRGLTLPAALTAALLAEGVAPGAGPAALATATVKAALLTAAGQAKAGVVPASVVALAEAGTRSLSLMKLRVAALLVVGVCALGAGAGVMVQRASTAKEPEAQPADQPKSVAKKEEPKSQNAKQPRTDRYGDPLPEGAIARLGTVRWRLRSGADAMVIL